MSLRRCQKCGVKTLCYDSRPTEQYTIRRYECIAGHRYTTMEFMVDPAEGRKMLNPKVLMEYREKYFASVEAVKTLEKVRELLRD